MDNRYLWYLIPIILIILAGGSLFYAQHKLDKKENELEVKAELIKEEQEERKGKIVAWIQELTDHEAEYLYFENDSSLYVIKAGKDLYKVQYDMDTEDIKYVIYEDKVVYER